jgi:hypothetical protein
MNRSTIAAVASLCWVLVSVGCTPVVESFSLSTEDGAIALRERPAMPPEKEGRLFATNEGFATSRYRLETPYAIAQGGRALLLSYAGSASDPALELEDAEGELTVVSLPAPDGIRKELSLPLDEGYRLAAFRIVAADATEARLHSAAVGPPHRGITFTDDAVRLEVGYDGATYADGTHRDRKSVV